jgi:hypothetical protein
MTTNLIYQAARRAKMGYTFFDPKYTDSYEIGDIYEEEKALQSRAEWDLGTVT